MRMRRGFDGWVRSIFGSSICKINSCVAWPLPLTRHIFLFGISRREWLEGKNPSWAELGMFMGLCRGQKGDGIRELQVYKLKTGAHASLPKMVLVPEWHFRGCWWEESPGRKRAGVGSPQGHVRDSLVPCSQQSLAPLPQLPPCCGSKSLMKLELLESVN